MEFKDFIGKHMLFGVDETCENVKIYGHTEIVNCIYFGIDGIVYRAQEDPDDGYRSFCEEVEVSSRRIINTFKEQEVFGVMREHGSFNSLESDVIDFIDTTTNRVVLSIGTDDVDDWYPVCVMDFNPENMAINIGI